MFTFRWKTLSGSYRALMRANPYAVIEGGLIAAWAVGADRVAVAIKATFETERQHLEAAVAQIIAAGWAGDVALDVVDVAGHVAPNPGGVGPMTRAMLLQNVVLAAERSAPVEAFSA